MYCFNCGTQLPEEASFCWKCGKSQKGEVSNPNTEVQTEEQWEACQIELEYIKQALIGKSTLRFWAKAICPTGPYRAAISPEFKGRKTLHENENAYAARDVLRAKLAEDGWLEMGREAGAFAPSWSYIYRRRWDPARQQAEEAE